MVKFFLYKMDIIVIATNQSCGFCEKLRGNGSIYPGKEGWNSDFFRSLIAPNGKKKYIVYEIFYSRMSEHSPFNDITSLSSWDIIEDKVVHYKYTKNNTNSEDRVLLNINNGKQNTTKIINTGFISMLKSMIPEDITRFLVFWPAFVVCDSKIWSEALNGKSLYVHIPGLLLEESNGKWSPKSMIKSEFGIIDTLKHINEGKISLIPKIELPKLPKKAIGCNLNYRLLSK